MTHVVARDLGPRSRAKVNGAPQCEYTCGLQRIDEDQVIQGAWVPSFYSYDGYCVV